MIQAVSSRVRILGAIASCIVGVIVLLLYSMHKTPSLPRFKSAMHSWELVRGAIPMWTMDLGKPLRMSLENSVNYGVYGPVADAQWDSIVPENGGIVHMGQERRPFMPSMFHQLQCLKIIRIAYLQVNSTAAQAADLTAQHCLNYLRQMILCRADLNLEQVIGEHFHTVHFRREQTCRNWEVPYAEHARNNAEYEEYVS